MILTKISFIKNKYIFDLNKYLFFSKSFLRKTLYKYSKIKFKYKINNDIQANY